MNLNKHLQLGLFLVSDRGAETDDEVKSFKTRSYLKKLEGFYRPRVGPRETLESEFQKPSRFARCRIFYDSTMGGQHQCHEKMAAPCGKDVFVKFSRDFVRFAKSGPFVNLPQVCECLAVYLLF